MVTNSTPMTSSTDVGGTFSPQDTLAVDITAQNVNWDSILRAVRVKVGATTAWWGQQESGRQYLVRFLYVDNDVVVVHLPLYPGPKCSGPMTPEIMHQSVRKVVNTLASIEYVATHTTIPVPRVIHSCLDPELDGVGSPYVVTSSVEGTPLGQVWESIPDAQRDMILEQVIDIQLELSTHRFNKIGSLFKTDEGGWLIEPSPGNGDFPDTTYKSGTDQYITICNTVLHKLEHGRFGQIGNKVDYPRFWFLRSLIPSLYDNKLDATGFPLVLGNFYPQDVFVVDVDTRPHITAISDWGNVGTVCSSSFAQYPFFIVNDPQWKEDHPLRSRNIRDQASFNRLLEEAERKRFPDTAPRLSQAFTSSKGPYLFEQCLRDEQNKILFQELVYHIFGDEEDGWEDMVRGFANGVMKNVMEKFAEEINIVDEVKKVLGDKVSLDDVKRKELIVIATKYQDLFFADGKVTSWLRKSAIPAERVDCLGN